MVPTGRESASAPRGVGAPWRRLSRPRRLAARHPRKRTVGEAFSPEEIRAAIRTAYLRRLNRASN